MLMRMLRSLLGGEVARAGRGYDGEDRHLVDSFPGFPAPRNEDFIPLRNRELTAEGPACQAGDGAAPEAHLAWDAFCEARNLSCVVLETGQAVLLKG
ncbi:MAG: hypothetical protein OEP48_10625 [Betaproteobacteria bacterium]|nr:hypothetical protein [Betaproteobacteria bacterium]MDH3436469.1 hypothetical protein [Betaproteobacteria bacterium]